MSERTYGGNLFLLPCGSLAGSLVGEYWRDIFGWSASKQRAWEDCKRQFFYRVIERFRQPRNSQEQAEFKWLSDLAPRDALLGQLVHSAIEQQISHHKAGRSMDREAAIRFLEHELEPYEENPQKNIIEVVNGYPLEEGFFERVHQEGVQHLNTFFDILWPHYEDLEYLKHEDFDKFEVDGVQALLKVDLASRSPDGTIVITDWKTGSPISDLDQDLQMGVYILWATQYYDASPENVRAEVGYTKTGKTEVTQRTEEELDHLTTRIKATGEEMVKVDDEAGMPTSPEKYKCTGCPYLTICSDGMQFVGDSPFNPYRSLT